MPPTQDWIEEAFAAINYSTTRYHAQDKIVLPWIQEIASSIMHYQGGGALTLTQLLHTSAEVKTRRIEVPHHISEAAKIGYEERRQADSWVLTGLARGWDHFTEEHSSTHQFHTSV